MEAACRTHPPVVGQSQVSWARGGDAQRRSRPLLAHPARATDAPDADAFHCVQSRKRWLRRTSPRPSRPVPPHLVGKCFNCGSENHVKAQCSPPPPRCINCGSECHRLRDCPFPALAVRSRKQRHSPYVVAAGHRRQPRQVSSRSGRSRSSGDTISGHSVSTERSTSVP